MSEELLTIKGKFTHTLFHNETNYYTVSRFKLYDVDEKNIIVTGFLNEIKNDILYELKGYYHEHPKYGMQFQIESLKECLPSDTDSIITYLSGPTFPGIGKKYAETIVEVLGQDCLEKIKTNPELIDLLPKMTDKKKESLINGVCKQDDLQQAIEFFSTHGLGIRNIMRLDRQYGKDALNKVKENPYRLVEEVDGIGFKTADKLAMNLGFELDDPKRLEAAVLSIILEECVNTGDSYILYDELDEIVYKEFNGLVDLDVCLDNLSERAQIVIEEDRIYHKTQYDAETFIADYFHHPLTESYGDRDNALVLAHLNQLTHEIGIEYDEKQTEAITTFFENDCTILTGGPGTGKTTVVRAMIEIYRRLYPYKMIAVCAPTGRASKRLSELADCQATTIHRLLKWDLETNTFGYDATNTLGESLLIVDEASMVDQWIFYHLLLAGKNFSKILIIGDEDQLPSVGIGSILKDLIDSELFPIVRLEKIYRQKEGSQVIDLANDIKHAKLDSLTNGKEVLFIEADQYEAKNHIINLVNQAIEKGYEVSDIQVLAPKYSGVCGIDSLNNSLQKSLNPASSNKREIQVGYKTFREGDKILQLKNQPDDDVYNGDIGILIDIYYANEQGNKTNTVVVDFDGVIVEYNSDTIQNISHAYCVSVHKAQGSEYPIVIMPILKCDQFMLTRRLIYTGITRASKSLVLLGEKEALQKGIEIVEHRKRRTTLKDRLIDKSGS